LHKHSKQQARCHFYRLIDRRIDDVSSCTLRTSYEPTTIRRLSFATPGVKSSRIQDKTSKQKAA
ncbi:MAG: hypothetical protein ACXW53_25720, partial [Candidatus Binatia bacterium]